MFQRWILFHLFATLTELRRFVLVLQQSQQLHFLLLPCQEHCLSLLGKTTLDPVPSEDSATNKKIEDEWPGSVEKQRDKYLELWITILQEH